MRERSDVSNLEVLQAKEIDAATIAATMLKEAFQ